MKILLKRQRGRRKLRVPKVRVRRRLPLDPLESAKAASLRYVDDASPGIKRVPRGRGFSYERADGRAVTDAATLKRIKSLVIPPAWKNVWICPAPDGHIQATGRDARGRKQYRYHPRFRQIRDETKYERMLSFAETLPRIRAKVDEDLGLPGLAREKVLATIVRLLELTLIRVGNEEYARENASFGLTTLRTRHVDVTGSNIRFKFRGKSGVEHAVEVYDRRVAKVVARCTDLPGQILFQYVDDGGALCTVESSDVNAYLKDISGADFTAKDFRTWAGTVLAATELNKLATAANTTASASASAAAADIDAAATTTAKALGATRKKNVVQAIRSVAERLGNTAAVCKKCYVHPAIVESYLDGTLVLEVEPWTVRDPKVEATAPALSAEETAVYALLCAYVVARRRQETSSPSPPTQPPSPRGGTTEKKAA